MKKLFIFLFFTVCISKVDYAQKEYNNWLFGSNSGLNFSGGAAAFMPGNIKSSEGCSTISDKYGSLLFYTNGVTVWDKTGQPMPNGSGLNGDLESTQSALITNHPGNDSIYYIFTVAKEGGSSGLQYSVVNMKQNGGLGDVDNAFGKNVPFNLPYCEKIAAIKHRNRNDIWVITHRYGTNEFEEFLIDCSGLTTTPQHLYSIGSVINTPLNAAGYLKVSPDGSKIAMANFNGNFELFDFDDATGVISNPQVIPANPVFLCGPYGVEFSPDSKLLYITGTYFCNTPVTYEVCQYNLDTVNIPASRLVLDIGTANVAAALQLAPDNKIYIAYYNSSFVGAITNPNARGLASSLVKQFINFPSPALCQGGLPNMITAYDKTLLGNDTVICDGSSKTIKLNLPNTTFEWSDGSTKDSFVITSSGTYWLKIAHNGCVYTDTINVIFQPTPKFSFGADISLCADKFPYTLENKINGASYLWQDSSVNSAFAVPGIGTYWLQASVNGCAFRDSINFTSRAVNTFSLGPDTTVCANVPLALSVDFSANKYLWSTGSTGKSIVPVTSNTYWAEATNSNGCSFRDSVQVNVKPVPLINLVKDTVVCKNTFPIIIGQNITGATYLWQDGSTNAMFTVDSIGTYWLQATLNGCSASYTIGINSNPVTSFELGADTIVCGTGPLSLTVQPTLANYLWSNGSKLKNLTVTASGTYWCEAMNSYGCVYRDSINVIFKPKPNVSLGNDTAICQDKFPLLLGLNAPGVSYTWQDGSTNSTFNVNMKGSYWVQATLNGCSSADTIQVSANPLPSFNLGADTVACENLPVTLIIRQTLGKYSWSTGSTFNSISVTKNGDYWAEGTNNLGCSFRDTINVNFKPAPVLNLGNDTSICANNFPFTVGKNITASSYLWQDGSTNPTYAIGGAGDYNVTATINGCSAQDAITIKAIDLPVFGFGPDTVSCNINPVKLSIKAQADKYLWSTGSSAASITVTASGDYWGEATNASGCVYRDTISVAYTKPPAFSLGRDTVLCQSTPLLLNVSNAGDSFLWQDNTNTSQYLVTKTGNYRVKVTKNGCSTSDTIQVTYLSKPAPDLGADTTICNGQPLILSAKAAGNFYLWQDGSTSNSFNVTKSGKYKVQVENQCGTGSDETTVNISSCKIMLPNAFTPGKTTNGIFRLTNAYGITEIRLQVFSRWGQQVYQTSKALEGWDGKFRGIDQPDGIYVFILSYKETDSGKLITQKGTIMLVR